MGLFNKKKEGGMMDMIRCDEADYLIWKWRPKGNQINTTNKENAIRWGSSLRVKDGEVAIFLYRQNNEITQEFIEGPHDDILRTANFPILAKIIGSAFDGGTPFQAEVYFINLTKVIQFQARVPYFDIFDPRFMDFGIKCAVKYQILCQITDYKSFIKIHRLSNLTTGEIHNKMKPVIDRFIKTMTIEIPKRNGIAAIQIETQLNEANIQSEKYIAPELERIFGLKVNSFIIDKIEIDKDDEQYYKLKKLTADITERKTLTQANIEIETLEAQSALNIRNLEDLQKINALNMEEQLMIRREELQRAQRLQTESSNFETHKLNIQTEAQKEVLKSAANNLGEMSSINLGNGDNNMNPAGMMTGMAMGGALGNQMASMMNQMGNNITSNEITNNHMPPPPPPVMYHIAIDGQQSGPFSKSQVEKMIFDGTLNKNSFVWKLGFDNWIEAGKLIELQSFFSNIIPPVPPSIK